MTLSSLRQLQRAFTSSGRQTPAGSDLRLGHFLERRDAFLESIGKKENISKSKETQSKLMAILSGPSLEEDRYCSKADKLPDLDQVFGANKDAQVARDEATIRQMMACSMHLGHATSRWNPKMAPYIYGERVGIHIINLEKTLVCLRQACNVVKDVASRGGAIVFVGTSDSFQRLTYECAQEAGQFYVNVRWIGGTITNRTQVLRNAMLAPDLLIVLDSATNRQAIEEARIANVPVIGICDTNFNPTLVTYPIPANDDAYASVELIARILARAAQEGKWTRTRSLAATEIVESATKFIDQVFGQR